MATYYDINGQKVQNLASDPSPVTEGQVWYNTTSNTAKFNSVTSADAWSTGGNLNASKSDGGGCGPQTAALYFGGSNGPSALDTTESYDGSSWTNLPATMNTARTVAASGGTQTAAVAAGQRGGNGQQTEEYNGSSWATGTSIGTSIYYRTGTGPQTALFIAGGSPDGTTNVTTTAEYDGSGWTTGGALATATSFAASVGSSADGLQISGGQASPSTYIANTQAYNGTSWSALNPVNTARKYGGASASGPTSTALFVGGSTSPPVYVSTCEKYDGTSWSATTSLSTARSNLAGGGTGSPTTALVSGGKTSPSARTNSTEEFNAAGALETVTITTS